MIGPLATTSLAGTPGERPDLRLVPAAITAWAAAGCATFVTPQVSVTASVTAAVAAVVLLRAHAVPVLAAALACAAGAGLATAARVAAVDAGPLPALAQARATATLDLVLTADPQRLPPRVRGPGPVRTVIVVRGRVERVAARGKITRIRSPVVAFADDERWLAALPSQTVRVVGRLSAAQPHDDATALVTIHGPPTQAMRPSPVQRVAERLRAGLRNAVTGLPAAERGLLPGLVVGDTAGMPPELVEDFRTAGLTHLTAVSGANISIVLAVVLLAGRWCGVTARAAPVVGGAAVAGFLVLARPEPSVLRASAMGAIGLLALALGGRRRGVPLLAAAVILLLLADPWLSRSYGFALSVLATAGLLVLGPPWRDALARRLPGPLAAAVAVPAAAQVACAPVVAMLSAEVSLVAVPANLLAGPAVAPATVLGVVATLVAPLSPPLARLAGQLAGLPASWIVGVAERSAALPGAAVPWTAGWRGALLLGLLLLAAGTLWPVLRRHGGRLLPVAAVAAIVTVGLRPALPVRWAIPGWPPPGWLMVACDVGQGDALVLNVASHAAIVVDAGPEPRAVDRCLRRLGVRAVPYLLLTHFHADHVEGVPGVLRRRAVREIGVGPVTEPALEAARVARWAKDHRVPITRAGVGEVRKAGPLSWRVLWPSRLISDGSLPNNTSLTILAQVSGVRLLLTGDVEPPAQRALLRAQPDLRADVLKVPHHGSPYQDPHFLRAIQARVAVVCVGAGNDYGHPAQSTLATLGAAGARVLRTDRDGDIAVVGTAEALRVVASSRTGVAAAVDDHGRQLRRPPPAGSGTVALAWHADRRCRRPQPRPSCRPP